MKEIQMTPSFPIVGIGASAGGLEAFQELLKYLPDNTGIAFVFVMHLSPEHKSVLSELLGRKTRMLVSEAKSRMPIEANHVYVIPPDMDMSIAGRKLVLQKMKGAGFRHLPVDCLFRSLAQEKGHSAIGVILSGTATDGTLGAEAIKSEGGITFAQDPASAKYDGMPHSAIAAGCIDFVLSPKKIAQELCNIARHPLISSVQADDARTFETISQEKGVVGLYAILRQTKGVDFTHYKSTTIMRRVLRQMVLLNLKKIKDYVKYLQGNKDEVGELYEDLLINVTEFFRDEKPFHILRKYILPKILKNRTKDQEVRIWVPGCSSGEEAYSIAICLAEVMGSRLRDVPVRIFATDVSERSIHKARRGIYGKNIKENVTPERLKRFFIKDGDSYKVSKVLRDMCVFSRQNLINDPPFSNLDLISCRNLLIYLQPVLQKKIFNYFHYSLKPGGFLLLGVSESAGGYAKMFRVRDAKQKIFEKKYFAPQPALDIGQKYYTPKGLLVSNKAGVAMDLQSRRLAEGTDIKAMIESALLSEYMPCGVLINSDMEVVSFLGHTGRFLESASGKPTYDIFKMAREGLLCLLRMALHEAKKTAHKVKKEGVVVLDHGRKRRVLITVIPVLNPSEKTGSKIRKESCFLVLFDEIGLTQGVSPKPKARRIPLKDGDYLEALQKELSETKEYLRTVTEEHETAIEELKAANEEILASNEELQSANEELETSKEELQSSNEELITTNEEMQNRNAEVSLLNNDLINLLGSINMPVIMMDTGLVIRRVTPQVEKALNVVPSDIGRPINKIKLNIDIPDLEKMLSEVIETLLPKKLDIRDKGGNWYSIHLKPYRTIDNKIDGVILIFFDFTERKKAEALIKESEKQLRAVLDSTPFPVALVDARDDKIEFWSRSAHVLFGHTAPTAAEWYQIAYPDPDYRREVIEQWKPALEVARQSGQTVNAGEYRVTCRDGSLRICELHARFLADKLIVTFNDITDRKRFESVQLFLSKCGFEDPREDFFHSLAPFLARTLEVDFVCIDQLEGDGLSARTLAVYLDGKFEDNMTYALKDTPCGDVVEKDICCFPKDVSRLFPKDEALRKLAAESYAGIILRGSGGEPIGLIAVISKKPLKDLYCVESVLRLVGVRAAGELERRKTQKALLISEAQLRTVLETVEEGIILSDEAGYYYIYNFAMEQLTGYSKEEANKSGDFMKLIYSDSEQYALEVQQLAILIKENRSQDIETVIRRKDGQLKDVLVYSVIVPYENRKLFLTTFRDITVRKQAENILKRDKKTIENLVREQAARLIEANIELERGKRLSDIGVLGATVAHELRNPLGTISMAASRIRKKDQAGSLTKHLDIISKKVKESDQIINNLLFYSRLKPSQYEDIAIFDVLDECINNSRMFVKKEVSVIKDIERIKVVHIKADPLQLKEVFQNVLNNAFDAVAVQAGIIEIRADRDNDLIKVIIKDNGIGMDKECLSKAFDPFFTTKTKGTGLGLSVCKQIIQMHKGSIDVETAPGQGTTFIISLPMGGGINDF